MKRYKVVIAGNIQNGGVITGILIDKTTGKVIQTVKRNISKNIESDIQDSQSPVSLTPITEEILKENIVEGILYDLKESLEVKDLYPMDKDTNFSDIDIEINY